MDARSILDISVYDNDEEEIIKEKIRQEVIGFAEEINKGDKDELKGAIWGLMEGCADLYYELQVEKSHRNAYAMSLLQIQQEQIIRSTTTALCFFSKEKLTDNMGETAFNTFMGTCGIALMLLSAAYENAPMASIGFGLLVAAAYFQLDQYEKDFGASQARVLMR